MEISEESLVSDKNALCCHKFFQFRHTPVHGRLLAVFSAVLSGVRLSSQRIYCQLANAETLIVCA